MDEEAVERQVLRRQTVRHGQIVGTSLKMNKIVVGKPVMKPEKIYLYYEEVFEVLIRK
jgi:hypothetical protein